VGFSFDCNYAWSLYGSQSSNSSISHVPTMSVHNIVRPIDASCWPTTRGGKNVKWPSIFKIAQQHTNNWEVGILFTQCIIFPIIWWPFIWVWMNL
jgi:hypothetical protein